MTGSTALALLSRKLCPWLRPGLRQLEAARAAGRLGHAWLVVGPRGVGKLNLALAFAERLLAGNDAALPPALTPAELAAAMRDRHGPADHHPDLHWLFPEEDKRTISVDQVRSVSEALSLKAYRGAGKVVVIEPADGMTGAAANALLKTLEEPAADTYLLLLSHQPERLPATIRSRCQRLTVGRPRMDELATWLGARADATAALWLASGGSALQMAESIDDNINKNNELEEQLILISKDKIDPQIVADDWFKRDYEHALAWLMRRIHLSVRGRLAPNASTAVTDPGADALHNAWTELTLGTLFDRYQTAQGLLNQLGAGINMELALRALLLGFQPDRGRP